MGNDIKAPTFILLNKKTIFLIFRKKLLCNVFETVGNRFGVAIFIQGK